MPGTRADICFLRRSSDEGVIGSLASEWELLVKVLPLGPHASASISPRVTCGGSFEMGLWVDNSTLKARHTTSFCNRGDAGFTEELLQAYILSRSYLIHQ